MYSRCVGSEIEMPNKVLSTLLSVTVSKIRHVLLSKYPRTSFCRAVYGITRGTTSVIGMLILRSFILRDETFVDWLTSLI